MSDDENKNEGAFINAARAIGRNYYNEQLAEFRKQLDAGEGYFLEMTIEEIFQVFFGVPVEAATRAWNAQLKRKSP